MLRRAPGGICLADSSKTEKATPKKRRDERKKGNVFLSKDAVAVATLFGSLMVLRAMGPSIVSRLYVYLQYCLEFAAELPTGRLAGELGKIEAEGIYAFLWAVLPMLMITVLCAVAATFAQTRFLVAGEALKPKFNRLSPLQGVKRLFSLKSIIEALKNTLKIAILLFIIYRYLLGMVGAISDYLYTDLEAACQHLFDETMTMLLQISVAFAALAAFDFFYQWWEYERDMRMTKQEIKEEYKQMEGDPQIKGKIKEAQRKMSQSRMMQQVPQADVVIRNPTHYAVALRYQPERDNAPVVLAKGMDELALRIVKVAEENGVAVVENVSVARALYASAELDREIPPELYGAVADVLVYLYRLEPGRQE